jgi:hypothetical protein
MISVVKVPAKIIPCHKWVAYKNAPLPQAQDFPRSHTVVIVYRTPSKIKYFYVTSQVERAKMRYRYDKSALVEMQKSEWTEVLTKDVSYIQCGKKHLNCIDVLAFKKLYDETNGEMNFIGEIPENIKQKIKAAIKASVTYSTIEKSELIDDK